MLYLEKKPTYVLVHGPEQPVDGLLGDDDRAAGQADPAARPNPEEDGVTRTRMRKKLDDLVQHDRERGRAHSV